MYRTTRNLLTDEESQIPLTTQEITALQNVSQPVVIREIDARRLRLALLQLGLLSTVEAAIASLGEAAKIDWEFATFIREDYPLVVALSANLGLDVDVLFTLASSLA